MVISKGRATAVCTSSELEEKYSSDILLITSKNTAGQRPPLRGLREVRDEQRRGRIKIQLPGTGDSTDLIVRYREYIDALEVKMGMMDDEFIGITGEIMI